MLSASRLRTRLGLLASLALLASALPGPTPSQAQSPQTRRTPTASIAQSSQIRRNIAASLTNDLQQFATGQLQRTGLSTTKSSAPSDQAGAVQLLPSAEITAWRDSGDLPAPRSEEAAVYLEYATVNNAKKGRIFVLGGRVGANSPQPAKSVLSAEVQQEIIVTGTATIDQRGELVLPAGQTNAWRSELDLPVQVDNVDPNIDANDDGTANTVGEVPERTNIAAVSVSKPGGGGYIYAIGGLYDQPNAQINRSDLVSSPEVSIGTVNALGTISAWRNGRKLNIGDPTKADDDRPLRSASAFVLTAQNGNTYLYVVGGVNQRFNGDQIELVGSDQVYRSQLDLATGDLGAWAAVATIPVRADTNTTDDTTVGVWDAGVAVTRFQPTQGAPQDTLFVIGGQARVARSGEAAIFLSQAYQAAIGSDGGVTFTPNNTNAGTLTAAFSQHTVASYNGAIYVLGGVQGSVVAPTTAVQGTFVEEDAASGGPRLAKPGPSGSTNNFVRNDNLGPNKPRAAHSTVVVPAGETKAYVYVIGGRGNGTAAEADTFFGIIGGDQNATKFIPSGFFYSKAYNLIDLARAEGYSIEAGKLKNLVWDSTMTQTLGHDIQMWYRISNANSIDPAAPWVPITATLAAAGKGSLDGTSGVGSVASNRADFGDQSARLIQFRAQLFSPGGTGTPLLRRVALEFEIAGAPNLKFPDSPFTKVLTTNSGKPALDNITVKIANKDTAELPLLDARYSNDLTVFYVELYINPTTEPPPFGTKGVAYAIVKAEQLPKNTELELKQWCSPASPANGCTPVAISGLLLQPGTYKLYAYVDQLWPEEAQASPFGLLPETAGLPSAANEQDNVTLTPLTVTIAAPDQIPPECVANPNQPQCPLAPDPDPKPISDNTIISLPIVLFRR